MTKHLPSRGDHRAECEACRSDWRNRRKRIYYLADTGRGTGDFAANGRRAAKIIAAARQQKYTVSEIAVAAGVSETTVKRIERTSTAQAAIAKRLEAASFSVLERRRATGSNVDVERSIRQIRALGAQCYTTRWIASQLGMLPGNLSTISNHQSCVTTSTADMIDALSRRVGLERGPSKSAGLRAAANGWLPAMEYDDDWTLPEETDGVPLRGNRMLREMERGSRSMLTIEQLASKLAVAPHTVRTWVREGRVEYMRDGHKLMFARDVRRPKRRNA